MNSQTREKILGTALSMFNALGEPHVTTNHIADELGISPGNLYYYFRGKDAVIEQLFARYEARMDQALLRSRDRPQTLEDFASQLHEIFECGWAFRFLHRDLVEILSRGRKLKQRFARLLARVVESTADHLSDLAHAKLLSGTPDEIRTTAEHIVLLATFWFNYAVVRGGKLDAAHTDLWKGIDQALALIAPFVAQQDRARLHAIAQTYKR